MRNALIAIGLAVAAALAAWGGFALLSSDGDTTPTSSRPAALGSSTTGGGTATTTTLSQPDPTTTRPPSTTAAPSSTTTSTTTTSTTSTTLPPPTVTTEPGVDPNSPPAVTITAPGGGQRFEAFYDPNTDRFCAAVGLSASIADPQGDAVVVEWFSSDDGFLGTGRSITAVLHPVLDTAQPTITARATDATGAVGQASVSVIVWIRSDE